jgi:flavin reductase (DIM6/NTAB) family NADH-FMN oxidoreductase RutF
MDAGKIAYFWLRRSSPPLGQRVARPARGADIQARVPHCPGKGMAMDDDATHTILRHFPYGLYVVTVADGDATHGMTANWVTQASVEPPMVAMAVENVSRTIGLIRDARHFAVNLLHQGQRELAAKLGRSSASVPQKLKGVATKPAPTSSVPVLAESVGWLGCRLVATLPAGDHTLVLGQVVEAGVERPEAAALTLEEAGFAYPE